ncbi:MAG: hypothetical protein ACI915_001949 [Gammaproteobacteria bacterium]|jgi:hypothetical protein
MNLRTRADKLEFGVMWPEKYGLESNSLSSWIERELQRKFSIALLNKKLNAGAAIKNDFPHHKICSLTSTKKSDPGYSSTTGYPEHILNLHARRYNNICRVKRLKGLFNC